MMGTLVRRQRFAGALLFVSIACGPGTRQVPPRESPAAATSSNSNYVVVPIGELDKKRIAGIRQPQLSDGVMIDFLETGERRPRMQVALCLDPSGAASEIKVLKSSSHDMADQIMVDAMRKWRFSPTLVDGTPVSVCTVVTYNWIIEVERPPQN